MFTQVMVRDLNYSEHARESHALPAVSASRDIAEAERFRFM